MPQTLFNNVSVRHLFQLLNSFIWQLQAQV